MFDVIEQYNEESPLSSYPINIPSPGATSSSVNDLGKVRLILEKYATKMKLKSKNMKKKDNWLNQPSPFDKNKNARKQSSPLQQTQNKSSAASASLINQSQPRSPKKKKPERTLFGICYEKYWCIVCDYSLSGSKTQVTSHLRQHHSDEPCQIIMITNQGMFKVDKEDFLPANKSEKRTNYRMFQKK